MISWFKRLQISDDMDEVLRSTERKTRIPLSLHSSIMHAVRKADRHSESKGHHQRTGLVDWLPLPIGAAAAIVLGWILIRHQATPIPSSSGSGPQSITLAFSPFEFRDEVVKSVPSVVFAPLTNELQLINKDLERTADFLLASLP
jgi:hypothetical protein